MDTSESIKRSPFHSPFYSGRTSYGGAASGQRLRFKRPRTESTLPSVSKASCVESLAGMYSFEVHR